MPHAEQYEKVAIASPAELRTWLAAHHARAEGVWLVTFRKHVGASYVSRDAVLDELLCFGWIDGMTRKLDGDRTMQLITPRRTHEWTESYRRRAARLDAEGRLAAPGLAAIAHARASGGWEAHADVDALEMPEDLQAAFSPSVAASRWFMTAAPSYRRNVLRWIAKAQRPATRSARIAAVVAASSSMERIRNL